jgi:hypothetical protein
MSAKITNDPPGRIGQIGSGWTVQLDAMPHSALDSSPSTGVVNFTAEADYDAHLTMNNDSVFTYIDDSKIDVPDVSIGPSVLTQGGGGTPPPVVTPENGTNPSYGQLTYGGGYFGGSPASANTPEPAYGGGGYSQEFYSGIAYAVAYGSGELGGMYFGGTPNAITDGYDAGGYGTGGYNRSTQADSSSSDSAGTTGDTTAATYVYEYPGALDIVSQVSGRIDSVSLQGRSASFTQGTALTQFSTADTAIPAVTSGSPVAAFNLAYQLAGNNPCSFRDKGGTYWSLRGHDAGFNTTGGQVSPLDNTTYKPYKVNSNDVLFRRWDVKDSFASTGWSVDGGDFWSTGGVGSSVAATAGKRTIIVTTVNLDSRSFVIQFGSSVSPGFLGFGPDDATTGRGKWFALSLHGPTLSATLDGQYRAGGDYISVNKTASLTGVDTTLPVQLVIDIGFPTAKTFALTAYVQNVNSTGDPAVITSGTLNTTVDLFSAPWKSAGYMNGLYTVDLDFVSSDPTDYLAPYEDWSAQPLCDIDSYGISTPILPYTGSLWDYLTQVCVARQVGLRVLSGQFSMSAMTDDSITAQKWHPAASPTFAIDNSNVASTVEVDAQFANFAPAPRIYDALVDNNQSFSLTPGTVNTFSVTTTCINALVYNPEPLYDVTDFLNGIHPYGAYIVTGPDNLPIQPTEWISFGGSVSVAQSGTNALTVTVVCPSLPLGTTTGDYSLAVSDSGNSYGMLRLTSPAGGTVTDHKTVFQTGAGFVIGKNSNSPTISNVAATNHVALQNVATWAIAQAAGPTLTLQGEMPLEDLRSWQSADFGFVPGATILFKNHQWRIQTCTVSNLSVQFTATPYLTYQSVAFASNWSKFTVDDYTTFWEGKTYDDMNVMALAGPNYDWGPEGAEARFSMYPGGGSAIDDPGLDPSPTLLPSPLLDPDAPGVLYTSGGLFPDVTDFPGAQDYTIPGTAVLNIGEIYPEPADEFPGSNEDPT